MPRKSSATTGLHPVFGRLLSTEQHETDESLDRRHFANVAVEGEFAVTLCRGIGPDDVSMASIVSALGTAFSIIEVLSTEVALVHNPGELQSVRAAPNRRPAPPT
jgi:2-keto-4-pentenoate hydratase